MNLGVIRAPELEVAILKNTRHLCRHLKITHYGLLTPSSPHPHYDFMSTK